MVTSVCVKANSPSSGLAGDNEAAAVDEEGGLDEEVATEVDVDELPPTKVRTSWAEQPLTSSSNEPCTSLVRFQIFSIYKLFTPTLLI